MKNYSLQEALKDLKEDSNFNDMPDSYQNRVADDFSDLFNPQIMHKSYVEHLNDALKIYDMKVVGGKEKNNGKVSLYVNKGSELIAEVEIFWREYGISNPNFPSAPVIRGNTGWKASMTAKLKGNQNKYWQFDKQIIGKPFTGKASEQLGIDLIDLEIPENYTKLAKKINYIYELYTRCNDAMQEFKDKYIGKETIFGNIIKEEDIYFKPGNGGGQRSFGIGLQIPSEALKNSDYSGPIPAIFFINLHRGWKNYKGWYYEAYNGSKPTTSPIKDEN